MIGIFFIDSDVLQNIQTVEHDDFDDNNSDEDHKSDDNYTSDDDDDDISDGFVFGDSQFHN